MGWRRITPNTQSTSRRMVYRRRMKMKGILIRAVRGKGGVAMGMGMESYENEVDAVDVAEEQHVVGAGVGVDDDDNDNDDGAADGSECTAVGEWGGVCC